MVTAAALRPPSRPLERHCRHPTAVTRPQWSRPALLAPHSPVRAPPCPALPGVCPALPRTPRCVPRLAPPLPVRAQPCPAPPGACPALPRPYPCMPRLAPPLPVHAPSSPPRLTRACFALPPAPGSLPALRRSKQVAQTCQHHASKQQPPALRRPPVSGRPPPWPSRPPAQLLLRDVQPCSCVRHRALPRPPCPRPPPPCPCPRPPWPCRHWPS